MRFFLFFFSLVYAGGFNYFLTTRIRNENNNFEIKLTKMKLYFKILSKILKFSGFRVKIRILSKIFKNLGTFGFGLGSDSDFRIEKFKI